MCIRDSELGGIETGASFWFRDEPGGCPYLARRCPAWRRRESGLRLLYGTWEGESRHSRWLLATDRRRQGVSQAGRTREGLSTVARLAGGPVRSSGEVLVMGVERRGRVVRGLFVWSTGVTREELCERAEIVRKAVCYCEAGGVAGVHEGEGQSRGCWGRRMLD